VEADEDGLRHVHGAEEHVERPPLAGEQQHGEPDQEQPGRGQKPDEHAVVARPPDEERVGDRAGHGGDRREDERRRERFRSVAREEQRVRAGETDGLREHDDAREKREERETLALLTPDVREDHAPDEAVPSSGVAHRRNPELLQGAGRLPGTWARGISRV